jgi:dTDP-4-dehydrorhamnose 3,5-epimerase
MTAKSDGIQVELGVIDGVFIWECMLREDNRGYFFKPYSSLELAPAIGHFETFEHFFTLSKKGVFRGMHFQGNPHAVSKIISIVKGEIIDFLLDLREESSTHRKLQIIPLSDRTPSSIFVPEGVAHGYLTLTEDTIISYRQNGPFCNHCDAGVNPISIQEYLGVKLENTIQSQRDLELPVFNAFNYSSECAK